MKEELISDTNTLGYFTKTKVGDVVTVGGYVNEMVITGVDEYMTNLLKELHWTVADLDYVLGNKKLNNADPISNKEIEHKNNKRITL